MDDEFHPEKKLFPPHNLRNTSGRELYGSLGQFYQEIKDDSRVFWIDKRYYSAFSGTQLDILLRERKVDALVLVGLMTDICVLHTAIAAYHLGYQIEIFKEAVASLSETSTNWALNHFEKVLGAKII